jgi:hypothetical protein
MPRKLQKAARRSPKFKWEEKSDTAFLAIKNDYDEYDSEYHVHIYKVDGERDYTWEVIGPLGPLGYDECKTISQGKKASLLLLGRLFNMKNMVNA